MFFKKTILVPVSPAYGLPASFRIAKKVPVSFAQWVLSAFPRFLAAMGLTCGILAAGHAAAIPLF